MSLVTDILTYDQLHDLWGAGFTIVRRNPDPFEIDPKLIPVGMAYQWNPIKSDGPEVLQPTGWTPVPYSRHEGVFAPWGMPGDVQRGGLMLCERPKVHVELQREAARAAANKMVDDWAAKAAAEGITGTVRVATQTEPGKLDSDEMRPIGESIYANPSTRAIETTVGIPRDMTPHIASIFKERDRLEAEVVRKDRTLAPGPIADKFYAAVEADKGAPWWPTLRAILLPIAVENVRAALKEDKTDE
jgi:hypothetical protein